MDCPRPRDKPRGHRTGRGELRAAPGRTASPGAIRGSTTYTVDRAKQSVAAGGKHLFARVRIAAHGRVHRDAPGDLCSTLRPHRPAIVRFEEPARRPGQKMIAVQRIDHQLVEAGSLERRSRLQCPCGAAVGGTQKTDAQHRLRVSFAGARVGDQRVGGIECNRADRERGLVVTPGRPGFSCVFRFPDATSASADQGVIRVAWIDRDSNDASRNRRPAACPLAVGLPVRDAEGAQRSPGLVDRRRRCGPGEVGLFGECPEIRRLGVAPCPARNRRARRGSRAGGGCRSGFASDVRFAGLTLTLEEIESRERFAAAHAWQPSLSLLRARLGPTGCGSCPRKFRG